MFVHHQSVTWMNVELYVTTFIDIHVQGVDIMMYIDYTSSFKILL